MDQHANPGGGPLPDTLQNNTTQLTTDLMADLAAAMATLAHISTMQLATNLSKAKVVQKLSPSKKSKRATLVVSSLPLPCGPWPKVLLSTLLINKAMWSVAAIWNGSEQHFRTCKTMPWCGLLQLWRSLPVEESYSVIDRRASKSNSRCVLRLLMKPLMPRKNFASSGKIPLQSLNMPHHSRSSWHALDISQLTSEIDSTSISPLASKTSSFTLLILSVPLTS